MAAPLLDGSDKIVLGFKWQSSKVDGAKFGLLEDKLASFHVVHHFSQSFVAAIQEFAHKFYFLKSKKKDSNAFFPMHISGRLGGKYKNDEIDLEYRSDFQAWPQVVLEPKRSERAFSGLRFL